MMSVRNEQRRKYMGSEKFSWEEMRIELRDPKVYFSSIIQFCQDILLYGFSTFLPAVLRSLGYSSLMSNVLTVPVYAWAAIIYIAMAYFADRYSKYAVVCFSSSSAQSQLTIGYVVPHRRQLLRYSRLHHPPRLLQRRRQILRHLPLRRRDIHRTRTERGLAERQRRTAVPPCPRHRSAAVHRKLCRHRRGTDLPQIPVCPGERVFPGIDGGGSGGYCRACIVPAPGECG